MKSLYLKTITFLTFLGAIFGITGIAIIFYNDLLSFNLNSGTTLGLMFALLATLSASIGNLIAIYNKKFLIFFITKCCICYDLWTIVALFVAIIKGSEFYIPVTNLSYMVGLTYLIIFGSIISFLCYIRFIENNTASTGGYIGVACQY